MCAGSHQPPGPSLGSSWRNLTSGELPVGERLLKVAGNYWRRVRRLQSCCGHYGEPGC